jgi:hypothetical protein
MWVVVVPIAVDTYQRLTYYPSGFIADLNRAERLYADYRSEMMENAGRTDYAWATHVYQLRLDTAQPVIDATMRGVPQPAQACLEEVGTSSRAVLDAPEDGAAFAWFVQSLDACRSATSGGPRS